MGPTGDFDPDEDFYEEDRPVAEVLAAYQRGIKGVTARPSCIELTAKPQAYVPAPPSLASPIRVSYESAMPAPILIPASR